jgi:hypothetical protein
MHKARKTRRGGGSAAGKGDKPAKTPNRGTAAARRHEPFHKQKRRQGGGKPDLTALSETYFHSTLMIS